MRMLQGILNIVFLFYGPIHIIRKGHLLLKKNVQPALNFF